MGFFRKKKAASNTTTRSTSNPPDSRRPRWLSLRANHRNERRSEKRDKREKDKQNKKNVEDPVTGGIWKWRQMMKGIRPEVQEEQQYFPQRARWDPIASWRRQQVEGENVDVQPTGFRWRRQLVEEESVDVQPMGFRSTIEAPMIGFAIVLIVALFSWWRCLHKQRASTQGQPHHVLEVEVIDKEDDAADLEEGYVASSPQTVRGRLARLFSAWGQGWKQSVDNLSANTEDICSGEAATSKSSTNEPVIPPGAGAASGGSHKAGEQEHTAAELPYRGLWRSDEKAAPGMARALFEKNIANTLCTTERAAFIKYAMDIVGAQTERLSVRGVIGRGKYGTVDEVEFLDFLGQTYALKTIQHGASKFTSQAALVEMTVFARLAGKPHDNVLGAMAIDDTSPQMPILMPKAVGDLESIMKDDNVTIGDKLGLVADMAKGALHLHEMGIVHRDLKPANLLLFKSEELGLHGKLADFGFAREIGESCPAMMGTPGFMAYESMSKKRVTGAAAHDVVGVAMVLLLICLRNKLKSPNLFAKMELINAEEMSKIKELMAAKNHGADVSADLELFQVSMTKRTMSDGSFARMMLKPENLDETLKSPQTLLDALPSFLATDPTERKDLKCLLELIQTMAEINKNCEG